jgi:hypothetical protein
MEYSEASLLEIWKKKLLTKNEKKEPKHKKIKSLDDDENEKWSSRINFYRNIGMIGKRNLKFNMDIKRL